MKSTLPSAHLVRHFLLFVMTVVFLLTMTRAAYALWKFPQLEKTGAFFTFFVQGLRFDLALIGMILIVPVVAGSLLSMLDATRPFAKFLINFFLFGGLLLVLLLELLSPWFVDAQGLRPDPSLLSAIEAPLSVMKTALMEHGIPALIALILCALILVAFWSRMEVRRFLRFRVSMPGALLTALVGGLLCLLAIWSTPDLTQSALNPDHASISEDVTINDLVMNTGFKNLYSVVQPFLKL